MKTDVLPGYRIEEARMEQSDALFPALGAIERACARIFPPGYIPEEFLDHTVPAELLAEGVANAALFVAFAAEGTAKEKGPGQAADPAGISQGKPVGYALLRYCDGHALLAQIDVHPEHARQGLGAALVKKIAEKAKSDGYNALYLTTFTSIVWNAPFYARLGFKALAGEQEPAFLKPILRLERDAGLPDRTGMRLALD